MSRIPTLRATVSESKHTELVSKARSHVDMLVARNDYAFSPDVFYELLSYCMHLVSTVENKPSRTQLKLHTIDLASYAASTYKMSDAEHEKIQYIIDHVCPALLDVMCDLYDGKWTKTVSCVDFIGHIWLWIIGRVYACSACFSCCA